MLSRIASRTLTSAPLARVSSRVCASSIAVARTPLVARNTVVASRTSPLCLFAAARNFTSSIIRASDAETSSPAATSTVSAPRVNSLVLTAAGPDRPGIVHDLTKLLATSGANVEESRMSILGSDFAILLRVTAPESLGVKELKTLVQGAFTEFAVGVRSNIGVAQLDGPMRILQIQVEGPDQPGVVQSLTKIFNDLKGSVRDLDTDCSNAPFAGYKIFQLKCVVAFPIDTNFEAFEKSLLAFEDAYGFDVNVQEGMNQEMDEEMDEDENDQEEPEEEEEAPRRRVASSSSSAPPPRRSAPAPPMPPPSRQAPPTPAPRGPTAPPRGPAAAPRGPPTSASRGPARR